MKPYDALVKTIQTGDPSETQSLVKQLLDQGKSPDEIIQKGIIEALDIVGKRFSSGECFIPEMLVAARACQKALDILKPSLVKENHETRGRVVIGTVKGDLHDIGKNIVGMMLETVGFEVTDLGVDAFPEGFIEAVQTVHPQIVALSCLLSTTTDSMRLTVDALRSAGLRDRVKVVIGGPPTSQAFAERIGADFYGQDAFAGVEIARKIVSH